MAVGLLLLTVILGGVILMVGLATEVAVAIALGAILLVAPLLLALTGASLGADTPASDDVSPISG